MDDRKVMEVEREAGGEELLDASRGMFPSDWRLSDS